MSHYPRLREVAERVLINHIRRRESFCKDKLEAFIGCQLAYINTNHEDIARYSRSLFPMFIFRFLLLSKLSYLFKCDPHKVIYKKQTV